MAQLMRCQDLMKSSASEMLWLLEWKIKLNFASGSRAALARKQCQLHWKGLRPSLSPGKARSCQGACCVLLQLVSLQDTMFQHLKWFHVTAAVSCSISGWSPVLPEGACLYWLLSLLRGSQEGWRIRKVQESSKEGLWLKIYFLNL